MKVSELMVREVECCGPQDNLEQIAMLMWNGDCGSIPVVDAEGCTLGIVTDRDITMASAMAHRPLWEIRAEEVTNGRPLFSCGEADDVQAALRTMWAQKVRRLPVMDAGGRLSGILSMGDVVACAERGSRGQPVPELSFDDAISTLKAVTRHH